VAQSRYHRGLGPRRTSSYRARSYLPQGTALSSGAWDEIARQYLYDTLDTPLSGTGADELKQEDGFYLLQQDGSYLQLDSAATNVNVDGETLTATPTLVAGVVSVNNAADELLQEDGFLILQEDGFSVLLDAGAGDVSVTGEILTATPSLLDGSVTGTANVTGETLTATPTLIAGNITGTAAVTGETLTATPTLTDGTVTGTASITGETLTVTVTLIDGDVTTDGNASVSGEILTATPTLIEGSVTGSANATGETLTATPTLVDGSVTTEGSVTVDGETFVVTTLLLGGDVSIVGVSTRPPGGDDAPRSHVGISPKRVKDKYEKRGVDREDIEEIYNRIQGIEPQTKAAKQAVKAVQKAVAPSASELPPASTLDWVAIENNLKAAIAIRRAYRIIQDEEDAVIALLLAA
jgi:hypothetical protein